MKYTILLDGDVIHNTGVKGYQIYNPKVTLELNKIGSFQFTMYSSHPYYSRISELKSVIKIYQDSDVLFEGRVLEKTLATNKSIDVYCESCEGYLCDSLFEPYTFSGTITQFLANLITSHNSQVGTDKQFTLGTVTVTDPNNTIARSNEEYDTTWNTIQNKLVDLLGGYIVIRHTSNGLVLDYLADFTTLNSQHVVFGKNILSVKINDDYTSVANVLIPLGAKDSTTGIRLTIESVNSGLKYLEDTEAITKYGRIVKSAIWDDVTLASNLKTKGQSYLASLKQPSATIEVTALDMANINQDINNFKMYSKIKVTSEYHNLDAYFIPTKMTIDLFNAKNNKITLNGEVANITGGTTSDSYDQIKTQINNVEEAYAQTEEQIASLSKRVTSESTQTAEAITSEVKTEVENQSELIEKQSTKLIQTEEHFEFLFDEFEQDLKDAINNTNAEFETIKKHIRFDNGEIILGVLGNEFTVKINNEKISFMQGGNEVAYLSNSKLNVTFANVINSIQIGEFSFTSREPNHNLTLKKVTVYDSQ